MISVGFSTYDRVGNIPELLAALSKQEYPGEPWEILAVDNGGPPAMRRAIEDHLPSNGRYIREEKPGSSNGRNRFFAEAAGDLVVLTDDDALPETGWLRAYAEAGRQYPEVDIFTGPVHYVWRCPMPSWYPCEPGHEIVLVYKSELGAADKQLDADDCVGGHNICLRRSRLAVLGGFDPQLGPGSPHGASGEDGELLSRWLAAGSMAMYVAAARTGHRIYPERLAAPTLISNYHRAGYSEAWETRIFRRNRSYLPMPAWWLKMIVSSPLKQFWQMLADRLRGRSSAAFYHRLRLSQWRGHMRFLKDLYLHRISPSAYLPAAGEPFAISAGTPHEPAAVIHEKV